MNIGVPENFISNVASSSSALTSQLSGVITLLIGIFLAFLIARMVIDVLRGNDNDDII